MSTSTRKGTVGRVVGLVRALAEAGGPIGVSELGRKLELPASTVHRLLNRLIQEGMAEKVPNGRKYGGGLELFRVCALVSRQHNLADVVEQHVHRIVRQCGEVCFCSLYLTAQRRLIAVYKVEIRQHSTVRVDLYQPLPLVRGAAGRSVLAFLPESDIADLIAEAERSPTNGAQLPSVAELSADLAIIRNKGYAITIGQGVGSAVELAVPIFGAKGSPIGNLCVTMCTPRFKANMESKVSALLGHEADRLNECFGYVPDQPRSSPSALMGRM